MVTVYTEAQWLALALAYLRRLYPGKPVGPKSFLGQQAQAVAQLGALLSKAAQDVDRDAVPGYDAGDGVIRSRCSSQRLDEWAFVFGLPSNRGPGKYGRNGAQAATGGAGTIAGAAGRTVAGGALLTDETGQIVVSLVSGVTVPGGGSATGAFQAQTVGSAGNLAVGSVLRWASPPAGIAATVTLTTALTNGYDVEQDLSLLQRLLQRLQAAPRGGSAADIRAWAESAQDSAGRSLGIVRAYVYPHRSGIGSSDVVITTGGSGSQRDPGAAAAALVQAWVDKLRAAGDTIFVLRPSIPPGLKLKIKVRCVPASGYGFDWTDATSPGGAPTGAGVFCNSATTTTITLPNVIYGTVSLAAAFAAGKSPRVQVSLPGYQVLPLQRRVTAVSTGGGTTVFTLDSALPGAPLAGQAIYPGGGAVDWVASALQAEVDSCGPSTQSGYQDMIFDSWKSQVGIANLARAALDALDDGGNRVLIHAPKTGLGVGIQLAVGAGAYGGDDFSPEDNTPGVPPQLAECSAILVTP